VTVENVNYAAVPFILVIGLCVLYYAFWGRHWFKPGGTRVNEDVKTLQQGVHVVVGTPGRVNDMITRSNSPLKCIDVKIFVLDEADELLSAGFKDQIHDIFQNLHPKCQVALFSATMPQEVLDITQRFMNKPLRILVKKEELTLEGIRQFYVVVEQDDWKLDTLCDLYETITVTQSVIFANTRRRIQFLEAEMTNRDFAVTALHGDMDTRTRREYLDRFRNGNSRVLMATDILARGIDVQQVSLVINYDLPLNKENYIHRIGRGGRFGRKGVAINFVTKEDAKILREIEAFYHTQIEEMPLNVADLL